MSNRGLLSFVIITYRNFDGIIDTLNSVFEQDYPRIQLVFSDDGSANYYDEIVKIKEYIKQNKTNNIEDVVYSHLEENQGTVKNINNAVSLAKGEYIKMLGGGDVLSTPAALTKYVDFLENSDYTIVFSKLIGVTEDGEYIEHLASCEEDYDMLRLMNSEELCNKLFVRNFLPAPAWCCKKELFERNGLYDESIRLIEDYPYWIKLCQNEEKIGFIDDVLIDYKLDGVSSTGSYGINFMNDMFLIYQKWIFPYDKRYKMIQPIYNKLKLMGLETYMSKAKWKNMNKMEKIMSYLKYWPFFLYIDINDMRIKLKNQKSK